MSSILQKQNIILNCVSKSKTTVIREMGQILVDGGYVQKEYIKAMLEKETVFNTAIGNSIAIPHGVENSKKYILKPGIVIMTFPQGIDWDSDEKVKVVIAIAANGNEHVDILTKISMALSEPEEVDHLLQCNEDEVLKMFTE